VRLLHVTQGYEPAVGGTERLIQRLSEELVHRHGDEVTVFTTNCYSGEAFNRPHMRRMATGVETRNGVRVRRFPVQAWLSRFFDRPQSWAYRRRLGISQHLRALYQGPIIPGLRRAVEREPADVIAASSFPLLHMFASLEAARRSRRSCVFYGGLHPEDDWGFGRPMIYDAIRRVPRYVAYSRYEADFVLARGAARDRVEVIPLGVDPASFAGSDRDASRRHLGIDDRPLVGFVGQLAHHKGVDTLLRALPLVWRQVPEAGLLIAGARAAFAEHIDRTLAAWPSEWRRRVLLNYDFAEADKPHLFAALDVFAYPSGFESFGIAFLEAWASGRPVIGCRRGAVPDVVDAGRDGLLVPFGDEGLLAAAILALLRNPGWARELGAAGRRKVEASLTWPHVAARFRAVLAEEAERFRRGGAPGGGGSSRPG
jgi:glycosyltransferase involved in cell wall biosynthesis